jgi:hypothetical protein
MRLRAQPTWVTIWCMKRSRELKPLTSEHQQALLVAFQLKNGLAGHADSAGAPRDLAGLLALARRFEDQVFRPHTRAEEDVLGSHLAEADMRRLVAEHEEMRRLVEAAKSARPPEQRAALGAFAELLERHVRWEERELFPAAEGLVDAETLAVIGGELEKRHVIAGSSAKSARR